MGTSLSPLYAIPVGITFGIPILHNEVLILNAETQLVACFSAFVITAYTQGGDAIAKMLDARAEAIIDEHNKIEDANISAVQAVIDAHKQRLNLIEDMSAIKAETAAAVKKLEAAKTAEFHFAMKENVESKLVNMIAREETVLQRISARLTSEAKAVVTAKFNASKEAKASALDGALAALKGAPVKSNPVKELYQGYFKDFTKHMESQAGKTVTLSPEETASVIAEIKLIQAREGIDSDKFVMSEIFDGKVTN